MVVNIQHYFNLWKKNASNIALYRNYDTWCEINNERLQEEIYAAKNNMDSIYWCWNCKYSDCEIH